MRARTPEYETGEPQHVRRLSDGGKQGHTEPSTRSRSYSDSLPGFFKRGHGYGEFVDDDELGSSQYDAMQQEGLSTDRELSLSGHGEKSDAETRAARMSEPAEETGCNNGTSKVSPQKPAMAGQGVSSKTLASNKAGAGTKTPPLPTKKTRMLSTDNDSNFEALQDTEEVSPGMPPASRHQGEKMTSPPGSRTPAMSTPRSSETGAATIARSSPGLMSQAARLAVSVGQAPYKAIARRKTDDFLPMEERSEHAGKMNGSRDPGSDEEGSTGPSSEGRSTPKYNTPAQSKWYPEATSPGAGIPLLGNSLDKSSPTKWPENPPKDKHKSASFPLPNSRHPAANPASKSANARYGQSSSRTAGLPSAATEEDAATAEAFNIFEPRPAVDSSERPAGDVREFAVSSRDSPTQTLDDVKAMKGHEALKVLQKGSVLRKKWLESRDPQEAPQSQKTERLIRCRVEDNNVVLHYYHQGVRGLLAKEEVRTTVQRVEIPDSSWKEGDCIILHTARGLLALAAPNAALHSVWVLGLNAALASCNTRGQEVLLTAPVRAIPRNSMFVVTPVL